MAERLLSQLAHVEILTPPPEESLRFYTHGQHLHEVFWEVQPLAPVGEGAAANGGLVTP